MTKIEWCPGMSVGIEPLDDDHKALLGLINEINEAIGNGNTPLLLEDLFNKLELSASEHFSREEDILRRSGYPALKLEQRLAQHQKFIKKIPELREQLIHADSLILAHEVGLLLFDWLTNHILIDDMAYVSTLREKGIANIPGKELSFWGRLYRWVAQKLVLNTRIYISNIVSVSGVAILSIAILWYSFQQYNNMQQILGLTDVIRVINTLTHSLQEERGLSTGLIGSDYQGFVTELAQKRQHTDLNASAFQETLKRLPAELYNQKMLAHLDDSQNGLLRLNSMRAAIEGQKSDVATMQDFYTGLITSLVSIYDAMALLDIDAEVTRHIIAISSMINLKETAGLERAYGTLAIEKGEFSLKSFQNSIRLLGRQEGLLKNFLNVANEKQQQHWHELTSKPVYREVIKLENLILNNQGDVSLPELDSNQWFNLLTLKINSINESIEYLLLDIEKETMRKIQGLQYIFISIFVILFLMFSLTLLLSWLLGQSIIYPMRLVTDAITRLSRGDRNVRIVNGFAEDEISQIIAAYELNRCKLLQADILDTLRSRKQEINLQQIKLEKEKYLRLATLDPLTGAINRGKLNELVEIEINRYKRHKRHFSIMMIDIDYFKRINDNYGHAIGDQVLRMFCSTCMESVRLTDIIARVGGEEFIVLLPETSLDQSMILAERLRLAVSDMSVDAQGTLVEVTASIGVASWDESFEVFEQMMEKADNALYEAKSNGRNRVMTA